MRVLMTSVPAFGHVGPILPLGRALQAAGHDVRIATHPDLHPLVAAAGVAAVAAGMSEADMLAERPRRWPETQGRPNVEWAVRMFAQIMAPAMRDDLLALAASWRPDLLIHEEGEYAGPVVAMELGIRCVTHAWGSPLRSADDLAQLETEAVLLWREAGFEVATAGGLYAHGLIDPCPPFLQAPRPGVRVAWPVRPETLHARRSRDHGETYPPGPLAYVGFGTVSMFANAPTEVTRAVEGCVARGFRTIVTTTDQELSDRLVASHGDRVVVRRFVSLPDLLPRCGVVVCHAGAGTVLGALAAGVPLVLVPRGAPSQVRMASACEAADVAVVANAVDPGALADAVEEATSDARSERAAAAAEEIRAMPTAEAVVPRLEAMAEA